MKKDLGEFAARKATVVVVAPQDAQRVKEYWKEAGLSYLGIPDEDGRLAHLYGQEWKALKLGRMPAMFVIDREGRLAFARFGKNMSDIPTDQEILKVLDGLP